MGKIRYTLIIMSFLIGFSVLGQADYRTSASTQIQQMIDVYNNRDIPRYVDFLLPAYYGNDQKVKMDFIEIWRKILKNDTDNFEFKKLMKLTHSGDQVQALFQINFRDKRKSYIIGISDNEGKIWKFSQPLSEDAQFDKILKSIPTLDHSFAKLIDPNFNNRINYNIGEEISPFNYTDIYGNEISSQALKGNVIVLNFWGTWCAPCIKEIPELNELVEKFKNENVSFIAPAVNTNKNMLVKNFLTKHPFLYDIVIVEGNNYSVTTFPTHIIINQKNEVVDIIEGYSKANTEELEKTIKQTL
ncbi:TlpA disulfide reductase family protein [Zunongwangia sp. F260]|uniref:TlpA disulfide reductase family protein n=1 Tax=Autumnicola lenta TaxID=3075593 RepID=A0ABU3CQ74_9FLAO|nr:TlpA disulfide reductase family protein [Zunongwangia sp. F260]MDT0648388.1 TlpA disulfide reductase family protein [Zunongwangia sp. F260]